MNDFPQPRSMHANGLFYHQPSLIEGKVIDSPVIGVYPEVPGQVTLPRKRFIALLKIANPWTNAEVVTRSDVIVVVDELLVVGVFRRQR